MDIRSTIAEQATRTAPVVPVVGLSLWGVTMQEWVYIAAFIYTCMQGAWLAYKAYRHFRYKEDA